jgi:hypothetical protein
MMFSSANAKNPSAPIKRKKRIRGRLESSLDYGSLFSMHMPDLREIFHNVQGIKIDLE